MNTILNKSLLESYVHSKVAIRNIETVIVELRAVQDNKAGKLQHRFEKLLQAHRNCMNQYEDSLSKDVKKEVDNQINNYLDECWDNQ